MICLHLRNIVPLLCALLLLNGCSKDPEPKPAPPPENPDATAPPAPSPSPDGTSTEPTTPEATDTESPAPADDPRFMPGKELDARIEAIHKLRAATQFNKALGSARRLKAEIKKHPRRREVNTLVQKLASENR